jgi:hypothetical protein
MLAAARLQSVTKTRHYSSAFHKCLAERPNLQRLAYAYNSLRAKPLVYICSGTTDVAVCPIPTLLFWRFTSGLYYDFIRIPAFGNLFGESYQSYVGEVLGAAAPSRAIHPERVYSIGSQQKRTVDWIMSDSENSALFIECKSKRIRWETKQMLSDTAALEEDIGYMASAVVQVYKAIQDCSGGHYPHFRIEEGAKVYPCIVTPEDWHMHGPVMYGFFRDQVLAKMAEEGLPDDYVTKMPYSIWPIDHFELGLQIMNETAISTFMDGKLLDDEMRDWEWLPYMSAKFKGHCKALFEDEYKKLFADFHSI